MAAGGSYLTNRPTWRIIPRLSSTACGRWRLSCWRLPFRRSWRSHCQAIVHCRRA